jgi:hypothetical protein
MTWPKYLPQKRTLVNRLLRWFDEASPHDIEEGATWYSQQQALASDLAPVLSNDGDGLARAAEIIAALSPKTIWSRNAAGAVLLITHGEALPGLLKRNVDMARRIMDGERLEDITVKAPKIRAFAKNIAGDTWEVTIDVHMAYAMGIDESTLGRVGCYEAASEAVRAAAVARGVEPSTLQATVWVVARRAKWSENRRRS